MQIRHAYSQTVADGTATSVVRPSDWNSGHNLQFTLAGNTTNASTVSGTNIPIAGLGNISVGASNGSLVISGGGGGVDRFMKEIIQGERLTSIVAMTQASITRRPMFNPFYMEGTGIAARTVRFIASVAGSSNRSLVGTFHCGIYVATNDTQLTLLASDSFSQSQTASSLHNGGMFLDFTGMSTLTLTREGRYAMAFMVNPSAANTANMPMTLWGGDNMPVISRIMNAGGSVALNATDQIVPFFGRYSTTTTAMPDSVALSQVEGASSAFAFEYYAAIREV